MDSYNDNPAFRAPITEPATPSYESQIANHPPEIIAPVSASTSATDPYIIKLSRPYLFEGQSFAEIDMTPLRDASTAVLLQAERAWTTKGGMSMQMETNMAYCFEVAATAINKPISFFERLPKSDGIAVKALVQQDFFGNVE